VAKTYDTLNSFGIDPEQATPMVRQFLKVKEGHTGVILFYRMGDFYETFFEDALITARALEITLTARDAGQLGKIPMAGVPVKAVDSYLTRLLNQNFKVAICEQTEDPSTAKGLVDRQVVRVLSKGTITDQSLLKPTENNYLAAIVLDEKSNVTPEKTFWGLAYCDVTTGAFQSTTLTYPQLLSELDRLQPSEVLTKGRKHRAIAGEGVDEIVPDVPTAISTTYACTPVSAVALNPNNTILILLNLFNVASIDGFGLAELPLSLMACGMVGYYLKANFIDTLPRFDTIQQYSLSQTVTLNTAARRNLELTATAKNNQFEGSLLWVLDHTATSMGGRLIRQWIQQPLTHLPEVQSRLDAVEELVNHPAIRESLRRLLPDIYDLERLSVKVANLSASPRDLVALKHSIEKLPEIATLVQPLTTFYLSRLQQFPPELFKLVALIDQAVDESPAQGIKDGGIIKRGYHQELDQLKDTLANHQAWIAQYEETERERTGIKTLKVSFNNAFGYFIEISRAQATNAPDDYQRKQTLTNAERFITPALKQEEARYFDAQNRLSDLEYQLFVALRQELLPYAPVLKDSAQRVAAVDVIQSLATVAVSHNYVKPTVDDSLELNIQDGRHPVIEKMLPMGKFVPNTAQLSADAHEYKLPQMMLISGPNMAGKSTYMRQVAIIALMAQMGSYVPASYARIGLIDSIYTRVGAVDDLASGQSTFMVEMNETAQILNGATRRSLVILDEVGRGTSTYDGVAIAWSVCEYLTTHLGCKTLFATHYHELAALEEVYPRIHNYRVCVSERATIDGGEIEFLHTVEPGAAQKSYGIQVARMAGLPGEVVTKANRLLVDMQKKELTHIQTRRLGAGETKPTPQLSLF